MEIPKASLLLCAHGGSCGRACEGVDAFAGEVAMNQANLIGIAGEVLVKHLHSADSVGALVVAEGHERDRRFGIATDQAGGC